MTAVLVAAARAVLGAVLVLVAIAAMLWAVYGPQGFWTVLWLLSAGVMVTGAALGISALAPPKGDG